MIIGANSIDLTGDFPVEWPENVQSMQLAGCFHVNPKKKIEFNSSVLASSQLS
jgi:hypothetical protein